MQRSGLDLDFCRAMLPRVSRTFAINIRLLSGSFRASVEVGYLLCRAADALEDSLPGGPERVGARFDALLRALDGDRAPARELAAEARAARGGSDLELLAGIDRVISAFGSLEDGDRAALRECLGVMAPGMARYAVRAAARGAAVPYLDDEGELHDYCWVVAGCVGVMLTRLFERRSPAPSAARTARRFELAPVVGEALQLTNILLDWPSDVRRGRCHVPAAWLAEFGLAPADLAGADRPGVRALAARLESFARSALARVPDYVGLLPRAALRYRLFVLWPALWAARSLDHAHADSEFPWGPRRPKLPRADVWRTAWSAVWTGDAAATLRPAETLTTAGGRP